MIDEFCRKVNGGLAARAIDVRRRAAYPMAYAQIRATAHAMPAHRTSPTLHPRLGDKIVGPSAGLLFLV